ncbi:MAG: hypothetical protein N5P05_002669 [Chroococcopsis gigantea SAG 12.99]|jgi:hypothetical protein|nr:FHA domain-containing protein [Chlorogloea purpurea SAG 13.99]MDV3001063.1 hypothetical protein [Chroococcopsis gigantea SAG 12.99]
MTILCIVCGYDKNPDTAEFCDACGSELNASTVDADMPVYEPQPVGLSINPAPVSNPTTLQTSTPTVIQDYSPAVKSTGSAKLIAKQVNSPIPEFVIQGAALIGIFDNEMGPVDIDLEDFHGKETVSRRHAEIYQESGQWKIKDLGSTNGVFIKPRGQTRFQARIDSPTPLNSGDEIAIAKILFTFQTI